MTKMEMSKKAAGRKVGSKQLAVGSGNSIVIPNTTYAGEVDGVKVRISASKPLTKATMLALVKMCKLAIQKEVSHG